jgi:YegS/Rv2252/BmrU family lipid kinase
MRDIVLIANAGAGSSETAAVEAAVEALRRHRRVEVVATEDPSELTGVLGDHDTSDVVVAGGDGSLHAVVAALWERGELARPTIGLVPLGTGNDFARGVGLPLDPVEAAAVITSGSQTPVDILVDDDGGIVVNVVHAGVGADAGVEARPWKARFGKAGYVIGAVTAAFRNDGTRLRVVADDVVLADGSRRILQVALGNGALVGGGFELTPDADPTDGKVDVLVSFAVAPLERLRYGLHLRRGRHSDRDDVRTVRAVHVSVSGEDFCCDTDGELAGPMPSRRWQVCPRAFTMMLPTAAQHSQA